MDRNFASAGKLYSGHVMPVLIDCNFIVDPANGNGLGIRSLKGPYVQNVFMHTSSTPGNGNVNPSTPNMPVLNPNPESGIIIVQLQDNLNRSLSGFNSLITPLSGSNLAVNASALTPNAPYVITVVGTSTAADWAALGVPAGVTPAPGVSFIAKVAGSGSGSGQVQAPASTGTAIMNLETIGDPNQSIGPQKNLQGFGAQFIIACRNSSGAIAAPTAQSVISLSFLLSNSSVLIQGE